MILENYSDGYGSGIRRVQLRWLGRLMLEYEFMECLPGA